MLSGLSVRQVLLAMCVGSLGLLAYGLYLQHVVGLEPCPMCIVQRYALVLVALLAGVSATGRGRKLQLAGSSLVLVMAVLGAFVAARQSWLQISCTRSCRSSGWPSYMRAT